MDVSDGLVQDLGHLARAAGLGAVLEAERVPRSAAARAWGDGCGTASPAAAAICSHASTKLAFSARMTKPMAKTAAVLSSCAVASPLGKKTWAK